MFIVNSRQSCPKSYIMNAVFFLTIYIKSEFILVRSGLRGCISDPKKKKPGKTHFQQSMTFFTAV